jgi:hypothetical protein
MLFMRSLIAAIEPTARHSQGTTRASIFLWVAAGLVVALGMARLPLIPDRLWRFFCWSGAVVLGFYAASRIRLIPSGWIWVTWAALVIVVLALLFWVEKLRDLENRGTEASKESATTVWSAPVHDTRSPSKPPPGHIFEGAPPELASMTPASLKEARSGRTDAQAQLLMEQHQGKPVRVAGKVENVDFSTAVPSVGLNGVVRHLCFFDPAEDYDPKPTLLALNKGDKIVVSGDTFRFGETSVSLDHCRLVEVRGR